MPQQDGLEHLNLHTFDCGCRFLVAWEETRTRHAFGHLVETHDDKKHGEKRWRIVNRDDAERIAERKRNHPHWQDHVIPAHGKTAVREVADEHGNTQRVKVPGRRMPPPRRCPAHATLGESRGAFLQVAADNNGS